MLLIGWFLRVLGESADISEKLSRVSAFSVTFVIFGA